MKADSLFARGRLHHRAGRADYFRDRKAACVEAYFSRFRARRLEQIAHHRTELVCAAENRVQVLVLLGTHLARQTIEQNSDELMNAGERRAQLMRDVGEKLVLEFELLLTADLKRAQQRLALNRM